MFCFRKKAPRSLFYHLVFILFLTAISVIFIVFGFFHFLRKEAHNHSLRLHLNQYAAYIASEIGEPPDTKKITELSEKLQLKIFYEPFNDQNQNVKMMNNLSENNKRNYHRERWSPGHFIKKFQGKKGVFIFIVNSPDSFGVIPRPVFILFFLLLLAFFFAWLILRQLVLPLKKMEEAFAKAARGDFSSELDLKRPRELASIGAAFNVMLKNIQKMLDARQQMLRDVSHDLRTPLTRIKLNLDFIKKSREKTSIEEDIRTMDGLISDIIESYKISGGQNNLRITSVNIKNLTRKLIHVQQAITPKRKIKITFTGENWNINLDEKK